MYAMLVTCLLVAFLQSADLTQTGMGSIEPAAAAATYPEGNGSDSSGESDTGDYTEEIQARTEAIKLEILRQLGKQSSVT